MEDKNEHVLKLVMKNGLTIALFSDEPTLDLLISHPKFLKLTDHANDVFVSVDDVCAFEILSNRAAPLVPESEAPQEADVPQSTPSTPEA